MSPEEIEARKAASAARLRAIKLAQALDAAALAVEAVPEAPTHTNLWRDDLALAMLAAFNDTSVAEMPDLPEWRQFANPWMARAWRRVAEAAVRYLANER